MYLRESRPGPDQDFKLPVKKGDANGMSKESVKEWNKGKALEIANSGVWGFYKDGKGERKNPWHPKLDMTMFWL
jgi:hypothetical protein